MKKSRYLQLLQRGKVIPNFWCSVEYFQRAGLEERQDGNWIYIWDPGAKIVMFPPIHIYWGMVTCPIMFEKYWADFQDYSTGYSENLYRPKFLDLEYTYDPRAFLNMAGNKWVVFRKNSRKLPNRIGPLQYIEPGPEHEEDIKALVRNWIGDRDLQEPEIIVAYALSGHCRRILLGKDGGLLGLNAWDDNWCRTNYRICLAESDPDYINDPLRLLFYTDPAIINQGKLINDGGVLDNPKLKFFKDKLNPLSVREVRSWIRR